MIQPTSGSNLGRSLVVGGCVCEGVCVDGAMILVSGSSGFRSRRTMRNQQPIRD